MRRLLPWFRGVKYIGSAIARPKDKLSKNFKRRKNVLLVKSRDRHLGRRPKLMPFSHNRKRNKGSRERARRRREDTDL